MLYAAYRQYFTVRNCHDARDGYALVYVSDEELDRAREAVKKKVEAAVKEADPSVDTESVWSEATKSQDKSNDPMADILAFTLRAQGREDQVCKMAVGRLAAILQTVAPEAAVVKKDF